MKREYFRRRHKPASILFVITKSVWGGAQTYVHDLATSLPKREFDVTVAAGGSGPLLEKLDHAGIRTVRLSAMERDVHLIKEFYSFFKLVRLITSTKPDIIHLNSSKAGAIGALAVLTAKILGRVRTRVVFTVHGWGFKEDRNRLQKLIIFSISWVSSLLQDKLILLTRADLESAQRFIPQRKLALIPLGISDPVFLSRQEGRDFFNRHLPRPLSPQTVIIGTTAELTKNKGLSHFIDAIHHMMNKTGDAILHCVIMGDGEEKKSLHQQAERLGVTNHISFLGFVPDAKKYLSGFDVFVLPSLKEGLPYAIMEAMSAGLPVVASNVGGIPDLLTHGISGCLVGAKNSEALASELTLLLHDRDKRKKIGENAQKSLRANFMFTRMIQRTITLYHEINP